MADSRPKAGNGPFCGVEAPAHRKWEDALSDNRLLRGRGGRDARSGEVEVSGGATPTQSWGYVQKDWANGEKSGQGSDLAPNTADSCSSSAAPSKFDAPAFNDGRRGGTNWLGDAALGGDGNACGRTVAPSATYWSDISDGRSLRSGRSTIRRVDGGTMFAGDAALGEDGRACGSTGAPYASDAGSSIRDGRSLRGGKTAASGVHGDCPPSSGAKAEYIDGAGSSGEPLPTSTFRPSSLCDDRCIRGGRIGPSAQSHAVMPAGAYTEDAIATSQPLQQQPNTTAPTDGALAVPLASETSNRGVCVEGGVRGHARAVVSWRGPGPGFLDLERGDNITLTTSAEVNGHYAGQSARTLRRGWFPVSAVERVDTTGSLAVQGVETEQVASVKKDANQSWKAYSDPSDNRIYFYNDVSGDWFFKDTPAPWQAFCDNDRIWWWHSEQTEDWFWEPV